MSIGSLIKGLTALSILFPAASQVSAGSSSLECYEPFRTEPMYDRVFESVMITPPRRYEQTIPRISGTRKRAVLIAPERVSYEIVPAVVRTKYRTVKVSDGGYAWEWRWINGRRVLCKVRIGPRYERVAERVVVRPEYRRRVIIPAQYSYQVEQVVIQPEIQRVVVAPPGYRTVARQVLVSAGTAGWRRVDIPRHCG